MKHLGLVILFLYSSLYAFASSIEFTEQEKAYIATNPIIRVCVNPTLAPFEFLTVEGKYQGIGAELLEHVAAKIPLNLEIIQTYSWKESLEKARNNDCDIVNFIPQTLEFNKWLLFSDPLFSDYNVLLTRSEHPYISDVHKLVDESLALGENSALYERLSHDFPNLTIFSVETPEDAIFLVLNKKIDMTIRSSTIMSYTIRKQGLLNLKIAAILEEYKNIFKIGIVGNNEILRDLLNKGIAALTANEREEIVNTYSPIVFDKKFDKKVWYFLITIFLSIVLILLWNYTLRKQVKKAIAINLVNQKIMVQQAKQAELGQLIGNISHQWREPLSNLSSINLMMIAFIEYNQKIDKDFLLTKFKEVENTLNFMSQTMQNFLEFYKPSTVQQYFTIYDAMQQTLSLVETNILAYKIAIEIQGDREAQVYGIKNEYMQVWLNLINNAIRAFQQSNVPTKVIHITIDKDVVKICDSAKGFISQSDLSKGIGLTMCSTILKKYDKKLTFKNSMEGVCVSIEPSSHEHHTPI
ncbi:MAG: transporter substrate-binding domain-containing protein [Sulfurospirillaceae bacterium]|nr:transporter substrate-binding domain-containing protein [Sulfurospirillaceae bacterium]